jgi:integrase
VAGVKGRRRGGNRDHAPHEPRAHPARAWRQAVDAITAPDVAQLVADLHSAGCARESIRKTLTTLAMILDYAGVTPNPARDRVAVKLPREDRAEVNPPTASHVLSVHRLLPRVLRLPLLTLDATGMRVGELAALTWGDVDEPQGRWRVSKNRREDAACAMGARQHGHLSSRRRNGAS